MMNLLSKFFGKPKQYYINVDTFGLAGRSFRLHPSDDHPEVYTLKDGLKIVEHLNAFYGCDGPFVRNYYSLVEVEGEVNDNASK